MKTIKEFVNQLRTEKSFAQKYANFDEDEFIAEAKKDGYEFSKEEFNDIADGKVSISLEDLENVTGGLSFKEWSKDFLDEFDCFSDMGKGIKKDLKPVGDAFKKAGKGIEKGGRAVGRFFKRIFS